MVKKRRKTQMPWVLPLAVSPVRGSDLLRTRTWPFWTEPMVRSKVRYNLWTEPIVRFWVLENPLKNRTKPNLTIPNGVEELLDFEDVEYNEEEEMEGFLTIENLQQQLEDEVGGELEQQLYEARV